MRRALGRLAICAFVLGLGGPALAGDEVGDYPDRPIRLIVPFGAGGPGRRRRPSARQTALTQSLGKSIVVDVRPGGSTIIGTEGRARQARRLHPADDLDHARVIRACSRVCPTIRWPISRR